MYPAFIFSSFWFYKQYLIRSADDEELSLLNKTLFSKLPHVGNRNTACRKRTRMKHIDEI